jgi:hypothetical protein
MAKEPSDLVLRLLRDIRSTQETQGQTLQHLDKRVEDLYQISTHTLGVAANAHVRYENLEARVALVARVERLEEKL